MLPPGISGGISAYGPADAQKSPSHSQTEDSVVHSRGQQDFSWRPVELSRKSRRDSLTLTLSGLSADGVVMPLSAHPVCCNVIAHCCCPCLYQCHGHLPTGEHVKGLPCGCQGKGGGPDAGDKLTGRFERRQRGMQVFVAVILVRAALQRSPLTRAACVLGDTTSLFYSYFLCSNSELNQPAETLDLLDWDLATSLGKKICREKQAPFIWSNVMRNES